MSADDPKYPIPEPIFDVLLKRTFVPVPEGMTVEDAANALDDARPWVPLPDGPTHRHQGSRLRLIRSDFTHEGRVESVEELTYFSGGNVSYETDDGMWFIHPDDVPDPDADLIERIAQTIADDLACEGVGTVSPLYRELATKALAVVREARA